MSEEIRQYKKDWSEYLEYLRICKEAVPRVKAKSFRERYGYEAVILEGDIKIIKDTDFNLFEKAVLDKFPKDETKFIMGVDTGDKGSCCYVLMKRAGNSTEILLSKTIRDEDEFNEEVKNLAKYFNVKEIIGG